MDSIGYKTIPVTINTHKGPISGSIGITYVREGKDLMIWDLWLNPALVERIDKTDQARFKAMGVSRFHGTIGPFTGSRQWEKVTYG